jgi:pyruvate, water dikinase
MSDFKTNEYAALIGGRQFEPHEENPMLGWRGASRYYHPDYREGFALECEAIRRAREDLGLNQRRHDDPVLPHDRGGRQASSKCSPTTDSCAAKKASRSTSWRRSRPTSSSPTEFAERFDGFSIGSNDLTQLVLGVDRDSDLLSAPLRRAQRGGEATIADLLEKARRCGIHTGICGQAPSDHPDFAEFLVEHGIDSISVTPVIADRSAQHRVLRFERVEYRALRHGRAVDVKAHLAVDSGQRPQVMR